MINDLLLALLPYPIMLSLAILALFANGHKLRKPRTISDPPAFLTVLRIGAWVLVAMDRN